MSSFIALGTPRECLICHQVMPVGTLIEWFTSPGVFGPIHAKGACPSNASAVQTSAPPGTSAPTGPAAPSGPEPRAGPSVRTDETLLTIERTATRVAEDGGADTYLIRATERVTTADGAATLRWRVDSLLDAYANGAQMPSHWWRP